MMIGLLALFVLIGAPVIAALVGWRVFFGRPWLDPSSLLTVIERSVFALIIAASAFSAWLDLGDKALGLIKP